MLHHVLLIDDDPVIEQGSLRHYLTRERGFECRREIWDAFVPQRLFQPGLELVVVVTPPELEAPLRLFAWLRGRPMHTPTLAVLRRDSSDELLRSVSQTVDDFVFRPVCEEELRCRVARILGSRPEEELSIRQRLRQELGLAQLVGDHPEFVRVIEMIPRIAASSAPVLLRGETGTGKELCAHAIHSLSSRHAGPFVPVECSAIPDSLVENELFGHARGAFTDAHSDQKGLAAMADGGTLFLDEIDSLPLPAQAKLLRFIQEGTYRPLGSQAFVRADLRLIAATNRDLEKCMREGQFRSDLYFRLNVLPVHLPALRERRADIPVLAKFFLSSLAASLGQPERKFSPAALRWLQAYDWPGNIRELYNIVHRAVAFSADSPILPLHLGLPASPADIEPETGDFRQAKSRVIENFERAYLEEMLRKHNGNVTRAAREAGKDRRVFGRLMKRYEIRRTA